MKICEYSWENKLTEIGYKWIIYNNMKFIYKIKLDMLEWIGWRDRCTVQWWQVRCMVSAAICCGWKQIFQMDCLLLIWSDLWAETSRRFIQWYVQRARNRIRGFLAFLICWTHILTADSCCIFLKIFFRPKVYFFAIPYFRAKVGSYAQRLL